MFSNGKKSELFAIDSEDSSSSIDRIIHKLYRSRSNDDNKVANDKDASEEMDCEKKRVSSVLASRIYHR